MQRQDAVETRSSCHEVVWRRNNRQSPVELWTWMNSKIKKEREGYTLEDSFTNERVCVASIRWENVSRSFVKRMLPGESLIKCHFWFYRFVFWFGRIVSANYPQTALTTWQVVFRDILILKYKGVHWYHMNECGFLYHKRVKAFLSLSSLALYIWIVTINSLQKVETKDKILSPDSRYYMLSLAPFEPIFNKSNAKITNNSKRFADLNIQSA